MLVVNNVMYDNKYNETTAYLDNTLLFPIHFHSTH